MKQQGSRQFLDFCTNVLPTCTLFAQWRTEATSGKPEKMKLDKS